MNATGFKMMTIVAVSAILFRCSSDEQLTTNANSEQAAELIEIAQTSAQLATGASFRIAGTQTDTTQTPHPRGGHDHHHQRHPGLLDGLSLLAPTDELLAIVDAETASDFRGFRISKTGGATITHFNAEGEPVNLPTPERNGPQGCSFTGKEHPQLDSILSTIIKTEIDFGTGVTFHHDTIEITRSGKIIIVRTINEAGFTEETTFENYIVNGAEISGTKTRVNTYDSAMNTGISTTTITDGQIVFADGTTSTWMSNKVRTTNVTLDDNGRPSTGTIVTEVNTSVTAIDGTVIYSHTSATPLIENIGCRRRHSPVSGVVDTQYRGDQLSLDFGDGSCENRTITITLNGVTTTKTIGE
jgi:hypothetical protein